MGVRTELGLRGSLHGLSCKAKVSKLSILCAALGRALEAVRGHHAARNHTHGTSPLTLGPEAGPASTEENPWESEPEAPTNLCQKGHSRPT